MNITLRSSVVYSLILALVLIAGCSEEGPLATNSEANLAVVDQDLMGNDGFDGSAKDNNTVPFHMDVWNTIEIVGPPPPPILHAIFGGGGRSHPFGPFDIFVTSEIDVTVYPQTQTGDYVFTFRNGDELHATSVGEAIEDPPGTPVFWGDITFAGGTGRFSNATGSGTYSGTANLAESTGQFEIDGSISSFGKRGH